MQKTVTEVQTAEPCGSGHRWQNAAPLVRCALVVLGALFVAVSAGRAQDPSKPFGISTNSDTPGLVLWDSCGWQGAAPCTILNPIYIGVSGAQPSFNFFGAAGGCDLPLTPSNGVCVDPGLRSTPQSAPGINAPAWLLAQESDQYGRISADLPLNMVPMLGTHNSYSNPQDGGTDILNLDQIYTITDQLNMGVRYIRLDPLSNSTSTSVMLCHTSPFNNSTGLEDFLEAVAGSSFASEVQNSPSFCGFQFSVPLALRGYMSFERPLYLALEEVKYWLQQHPGEVIVVDCNNFFTAYSNDSPIPGYVSEGDLELIFQHVFGSLLLERGDYQQQFASGAAWPTLRQVRSAGKQVLFMLHNFDSSGVTGGDSVVWKDPPVDSNLDYNSTSDGYFSTCQDYAGNSVNGRNSTGREDIGEDRTLSNSGTASTENGQISWLDAALASACGYSSISLDYLYALSNAPKISFAGVASVDYTTGGYVFTAGKDERPQWTIWSWPHDTNLSSTPQPAALVHQTSLSLQDTGVQIIFSTYPATSQWMNYRWQQLDASAALPFACAGPGGLGSGAFPDTSNWWGYQWAITTGTGNWYSGETECQKEFGSTFHFWRPMSGAENVNLTFILANAGIGEVWLNHFPAATQALPSQVTLSYGSSNSQTSADIVVSSGFGGALSATFTPQSGVNFLNTPTINGNLIHVSVNSQAVTASPMSTYNGTLTVTEQKPDGSGYSSASVGVVLNNSSNTFTASQGVNFISSTTQAVSLSSSPASISFTYDQAQTPSWLAVSFDQMSTPAKLTVTLNPASAPALGFYNVTLTPKNSAYPTLKIPILVTTVKVTVGANPSNVPIQIDGVQTQSGTFTWVLGSSHQLTASQTYSSISQPSTLYQFQNWSTGPLQVNPWSTLTVTAGPNASYVADYGTYYGLVIAQTVGGSVAESPQPSANGLYAAGTNVTLTATPGSGYVFKQFSGGVNSQQSPATVTMNGPQSVSATFAQAQYSTGFSTNPPGLSIVVDGQTYSTPITFAWSNPETHTVSGPQQPGTPGVQYLFSKWADNSSAANPRSFSSFSKSANYTLEFSTEYEVTVTVSPSLSGSVTGGGWFAPNTVTTLQATPAQGFNFSSYSGQVVSNQNPKQVTVTGPLQVTANFTAVKTPILYASAGATVDLGSGIIQVPIAINDFASGGPAGNVSIASVTVSGVPTGAGLPTLSGFPSGGLNVGTIFPGGSSQATITVNWPDSATRATFTIAYTANGGAYKGSNAITIFR